MLRASIQTLLLDRGAWIVLCLIFCGLSPTPLFALDPNRAPTQYTRSVWTGAQGLPQDYIHVITQTADGYLWIGTDEGLTRFDGYEFVTFTKQAGDLPSDSVTALSAGVDGTLWIGTANGLAGYRDHRFRTYDVHNSSADKSITSLCQDSTGTLWIAIGAHLTSLKDGKFTNYSTDDLRPLKSANVVYRDSRDRLFIAGLGGMLERRANKFIPIFGPQELGEQTIGSLYEDRAGTFWIGGGRGVLRRTIDGKMKLFDTRDGLPNRRVRDVLSDRDGNLWVGTSGGLSRLQGERFVTVPFDIVHDLDVRCFFEDREGDLWVGTNSGLNRFRDDQLTMYGRAEGLPSDQPIAVHQGRSGVVWVGYHSNGLVQFGPSNYRIYTTKQGLPSNEIFSIREKRNGDLLISTREGLSVMNGDRFTNYVLPEPLARRQVFDGMEDSEGQLWVIAPGGLAQLTGSEFRYRVPVSGRNQAGILSEGSEGTAWAAVGTAGLWQINKGQLSQISTLEKLGGDPVRSLYQDPDGTLWIGELGGGLVAYRDGAFLRYSVKDGLLSDNILHIEDDHNGSLWLSTTRGISKISKEQLREFTKGSIRKLSPENFDMKDGLRSAQSAPGYPVSGGGTRTADGRLWFPTTNGLAIFDSRTFRQPPTTPAPLVYLLDTVVDGKTVNNASHATLKAGTERIQFRYTGIHLRAPESVTYQYQLEGLDKGWVDAGSRRTIDFNTLGHGNYRFRVRASAGGQTSNEAAFDFEVSPFFYERAWFQALCMSFFAASLYGLYELRLRQVRGRFSLVLEERARMAREIHDTLAQGFVGISSQLDALALKMVSEGESSPGQRDLIQKLHLAQKMARYSLTEARRSVMDLRSTAFADKDLPTALINSARQWAAGSTVSVDTKITGQNIELQEDVEQNVLRIAQEAVTNALKHARAKKVSIALHLDAEKLEVIIRDDGQGFLVSEAFVPGEGHFGLLGMRERAERMGGNLEVLSNVGEGTKVIATLWLTRKHHRKAIGRSLNNLLRFLSRPIRSS